MDNKFTVIKGNSSVKDLYEKLEWKPVRQTSENVTSFYPIAYTTFVSERRLRKIVERLRETEGITITYDRFMEEEKEEEQKREELKEMFKDDDRVVVFDPKGFQK